MPRKKIDIKEEDLRKYIKEVEAKGPLSNRSELHNAIAEKYNHVISTGVIGLRIKEFNIKVKTPVGKRGRPVDAVVNRTTRGDKFKAKKYKRSFDTMREEMPQYKAIIKKIEKGSLKQAIRLKCLDCCGGYVNEIKHCNIEGCALWPFRHIQA